MASAIHPIYQDTKNVQFIFGKKRLLLLVHEKYLYQRVNGNFPVTTWKCTRERCAVTVKTKNGIFKECQTVEHHSHPTCTDEIDSLKANMRISNRVVSDFNLTPRQIHAEERAKLLLDGQHAAYLAMDSFSKSKSNLYKMRRQTFPTAPKHMRDVAIEGRWGLTLDKSDLFLLANDGIDEKILIFGTESNLNILCNSEYVISDGTFSVHPKIFKQLYVFHAPHLGKVLPLLFCLLPDKSYNTYYRLIELIRNIAVSNGTCFNPRKIHIDFEMAMIKAVSEIFSVDRVQGCLFHYCQCIWPKVQELGIASSYKNHKTIRQWIRRFSALPLLPISDIDDGFIAIHEAAPLPQNGIISSDQIVKFHDYMLSTWIHDSEAIYDRTLWNHYNNSGPRTTNNAEGWNHKLNQDAKTRLSFFKFIHFLQKLQVDLDATKFDLISESPSRQQNRHKTTNDTLLVAKTNYITGNVSILQYLDSVSVALKLD